MRYVLPNKHYIPVDMKYIGLDNTTPYVPRFSIAFQFSVLLIIIFGGYTIFGKRHLPRVVEQNMMDATGGWFFFLDRMPFRPFADLLRRENLVN